MIDERTHNGMVAMRAGGGGGASLGGRMGDSMPDYDNVKVSILMQIWSPRALTAWGTTRSFLAFEILWEHQRCAFWLAGGFEYLIAIIWRHISFGLFFRRKRS